MLTIRESIDELVRALEECDEVKRYKTACAKVREYPEKEKRLHEFRKKNYLLQNSKEQIDLYEESERLEQEYSDVYTDPVLVEFLDAEVAVCKIIQTINRDTIACLDFEDVLVDD